MKKGYETPIAVKVKLSGVDILSGASGEDNSKVDFSDGGEL